MGISLPILTRPRLFLLPVSELGNSRRRFQRWARLRRIDKLAQSRHQTTKLGDDRVTQAQASYYVESNRLWHPGAGADGRAVRFVVDVGL